MERRLHLGCGSKTPAGWLNLDGSWNAWLAKYPLVRKLLGTLGIVPRRLAESSWNQEVFVHDVRKRLPFSDHYFAAIYASHLLEHLYLEEAKALLQECYRVLKTGGVLRMVVPDLKAMVNNYHNDGQSSENDNEPMTRADRLNKQLLFRRPQPPEGNIIYRCYTALTDFHLHKWMYDVESLSHYFKWAGFVEVQERQLNESRIAGIEGIENPDQVLGGAGFCIEGIKPA